MIVWAELVPARRTPANVCAFDYRRFRFSRTSWPWPAYGRILLSMHLLFLERGKETLDHSIVPTVTPGTHTAHVSGDLKPPRVVQRIGCRGHSEKVTWWALLLRNAAPKPFPAPHAPVCLLQPVSHTPANDFAAFQVKDPSKILWLMSSGIG
jgi:hypothetical protein